MLRSNMPCHEKGQIFPVLLVQDHQYPKCLAVAGSGHHGVTTPDVIFIFWAKPDTGTIIEPQTPSFWLFLR